MFSCQALSSEEVLLVNLKSPPQTSLYYIRLQVTLVIGNVNSSSLLHKLMARVQTLLCNHCLSLFPTALPFKRLGSISNFLSGLMNRGQQARHRLSSRSLIAKQPTPPPVGSLLHRMPPQWTQTQVFHSHTHTHTALSSPTSLFQINSSSPPSSIYCLFVPIKHSQQHREVVGYNVVLYMGQQSI